MKLFKKNTIIWLSGAIFIIVLSVFFYMREYAALPDFVMPLMPEISKPRQEDKILVVSPHPDDEILAAAGYLADAAKAGAPIKIVLITNGDGHRLSTIEQFRKIRPNVNDYINSGYRRQQESIDALQILNLVEGNLIFLGYPDGGLKYLLNLNWQKPFRSPFTRASVSPYNNSFHPQVSYTGQNLTDDLAKIIADFAPTVVIAPYPADIHPDHRSAGLFTQKAIGSYHQPYQLYYYLIHFRNFPHPKNLYPSRPLVPPLKLFTLFDGWVKYSLSQDSIDLKEKALTAYQSQYREPFLRNLMEGFVRQNELFIKGN